MPKYHTQKFNGVGNAVAKEIDGWLHTFAKDNPSMKVEGYVVVGGNIIITISVV